MSESPSASKPTPPNAPSPAVNAAPPYPDEISLRELYLILKRGLPLILTVTSVAAVVTFVNLGLRSARYAAESVALVTPPAISIEGVQDLSFTPSSDVSFEAYETLANSRAVLEQATAAFATEYNQLNGNVSQLVGPRSGQTGSLLVTHQVTHSDPDTATGLANAWAEATLETVRTALINNIQPLSEITAGEVTALQLELSEAENALAVFEAEDTTASLEETVTRLAELIAAAEAELNLAEQGRLELTSVGELRTTSSSLPQLIAAAEAQLESFEGSGATEELIRTQAYLAGLQAQRESLAEQLSTYRTRYQTAQRELAALSSEQRRLERDLRLAESAFETAASLQPVIDYASELSPSSASLLSAASVPTTSTNPSPVLAALIAGLAGLLMGVLFVFLREAVSE